MPQGECPWCVRVTCIHRSGHDRICAWFGHRSKTSVLTPCPWCGATDAFDVRPVFHKLSTVCTFRKFARGSGPS